MGDKTLAQRVFGEKHATSVKARKKNGWKPTPAGLLEEIQRAGVMGRVFMHEDGALIHLIFNVNVSIGSGFKQY